MRKINTLSFSFNVSIYYDLPLQTAHHICVNIKN